MIRCLNKTYMVPELLVFERFVVGSRTVVGRWIKLRDGGD